MNEISAENPRPRRLCDVAGVFFFNTFNRSGRSRGGHIVVYEKLGDVDMRTLRRELGVTVPVLLR